MLILCSSSFGLSNGRQQPHAGDVGNAHSGAVDSSEAQTSSTDYRIGAGDVLEIRVLGEEQMSSPSVRVSEEGFIRVPFVGDDIRAQCLTERELSSLVADKLRKYLKYPEVFVSVKEYRSTPVSIIGAVNAPGRFQSQRSMRLLDLLTYAGGPKTEAGRYLYIVRSGPVDPCANPTASETGAPEENPGTETISLKRLMEGDISNNRVMRAGDIVIIPDADLIFVAGEVLKPNSYPLREGMTLSQALALAGGPSSVAKTDAIRIVRQEPGKPREEIVANFKDIIKNKAEDLVLQANDLIQVPNSAGKTFWKGFLGAVSGTAAQAPVRAIP